MLHDHFKIQEQKDCHLASQADEAAIRPASILKDGVHVDLREFWLERNRVRALLWRRMRTAAWSEFSRDLRIAESLMFTLGSHGLLDRMTVTCNQRYWFTCFDIDDLLNRMKDIK